MQVRSCKGKVPSKERKKNEVRLHCFFELFCIEIWLQRKKSYRFPFMYTATVQIPIGKEILYHFFKIPMNQRRPRGRKRLQQEDPHTPSEPEDSILHE
jgi:hypothetical protein